MSDDYLTVAEVAATLRVHPKTVQHWCATGRLPAVRLARRYRIRRADLAPLVPVSSGGPPAGEHTPAPAAATIESSAPAPDPPPAPTSFAPPAEEPRVIAVVNQKGGVGKTTTAVALAHALAEHSRRVLLVDFDPQASATYYLGVRPGEGPSVAGWILREHTLAEVARPTHFGFDLAPADRGLAAAINRLRAEETVPWQRRLARRLAEAAGRYDLVLLDCAPALDGAPIMGLVAADEALIVTEASVLPFASMRALESVIAEIQEEWNPRLRVLGLVAARVSPTIRLQQEVLEGLRSRYPAWWLGVTVPLSAAAQKSAAENVPVTYFDPNSAVAQAYRRLAEEVLRRAA